MVGGVGSDGPGRGKLLMSLGCPNLYSLLSEFIRKRLISFFGYALIQGFVLGNVDIGADSLALYHQGVDVCL